MEDVLILAIESSCDETAAAVVKNGRGSIIQCDFIPDCHSHTLRRCCTGDSLQKTHREDQPGH